MATPAKPHPAPRNPKSGRQEREWTKEQIEQFEIFMRTYPTLADTALFFKISQRGVERFCEKKFNMSFADLRASKMAWTKHLLKRQAIDLALRPEEPNIPMLKFCLTNLCQWSERNETQLNTTEIKIDIQDNEL